MTGFTPAGWPGRGPGVAHVKAQVKAGLHRPSDPQLPPLQNRAGGAAGPLQPGGGEARPHGYSQLSAMPTVLLFEGQMLSFLRSWEVAQKRCPGPRQAPGPLWPPVGMGFPLTLLETK